MQQNDLKKDLGWGSIIGILAVVVLAILIGSSFLLGWDLIITEPSVTYPAWVNPLGAIVAIVVLIVLIIVGLTTIKKRK